VSSSTLAPSLLETTVQFDEEVGSNEDLDVNTVYDEYVASGSNDSVDVEDEATGRTQDPPTGTDAPIVVISVPLVYEDVPSNDGN
jgi:hypothetical protein